MSDVDGGRGSDKDREDGRYDYLSRKFELSPEEKAVLLECRRRSSIRGVLVGGGLSMMLYWFKGQGRVPPFVNRYSSFFLGMTFLGGFFTGAGSYQKTCIKKIMSLENSELAKRLKGHRDMKMDEFSKKFPEHHPPKPKEKEPFPKLPSSPKQTTSPAPNVKLEEGPAINMQSYNQDRSMLETKEEMASQPDAFSSGARDSGDPAANYAPTSSQEEQQLPRRGRTFDEIREENRRKMSQQHRYPPADSSRDQQQSSSSSAQSMRRKRKNKYGDEIED